MDILGKSLDDLIKEDKKGKQAGNNKAGGGIHNKMRNLKAGGKK